MSSLVRGFERRKKVKNRVLLISLAVLLLGLVGCASEYVPETTEYNLTISSTEGGSVTAPGEGAHTQICLLQIKDTIFIYRFFGQR